MTQIEANEQPWKRQPNEPTKWYSRFEMYLSLGPERTIPMACAKVRQEKAGWDPNSSPTTTDSSFWRKAAATWNWRERAEAWDDWNRENLLRRNEQRRIDERETRIKIITQQLHIAEAALLSADLDALTPEQARRLLPTLRIFFKDMLEQHRTEIEPLPFTDRAEERSLTPFTAEELAAASAELSTTIHGQRNAWGLGTERDKTERDKTEGDKDDQAKGI